MVVDEQAGGKGAMRRVFLNNCDRRKHAALYGANAFYDPNLVGLQATMAMDLRAGDECVVATPGNSGNLIDFSWFRFLREDVLPDENGAQARVLFGDFLWSQEIDKAEAAQTEPYSRFFDVNGRFKRRSVVEQ